MSNEAAERLRGHFEDVDHDFCGYCRNVARVDIRDALARSAEAAPDLSHWIHHDPDCAWHRSDPKGCDCGLARVWDGRLVKRSTDTQTSGLLAACYERNIHSRGDMEYAFQPWALNVATLREAMHNEKWCKNSWLHERIHDPDDDTFRTLERLAAEYARLSAEEVDR